jgi:hypothetical protein
MVKLPEGVDASVAQARTVHGEITKVREGMEPNRNEAQAIRDEIAKLTSQLELQNSMLELQNSKMDFQTKMQSLAFAVQNAKLNSFDYYYGKDYGTQTGNSGDLLLLIFLGFRRGGPLAVKNGRMDQFTLMGGDAQLKSEQAFRDRLSNRIHELTGVKPRFEVKKEKDVYWIHYS